MDLVEQLLAGNRRALAKAITLVENRSPQAQEIMRRLHQRTGHAHTVGVTGSPGAGKSTLVAQLAKEFRRRGLTVGVIAVDPSSPFTHGAVLGDRVRMQDLTSDPEIFIRSMASREAIGGLAETTGEVLAVLDAFGKDVIIVETVGAGQDEVEIARVAQATLVVGTPGAGDEIQTMKAGILEIADIYVVNKADRDGAENLVSALEQLLSYAPPKGRKVPVIRTVATEDKGTAELVDAIQEHWRFLEDSGLSKKDELERTRYRLLGLVRRELLERLLSRSQANGTLDELVRSVADRTLDPHTATERLIDLLTKPPA